MLFKQDAETGAIPFLDAEHQLSVVIQGRGYGCPHISS